MIQTATTLPLSGAGLTLARNLMARLNASYPAFDGAWRVTVDEVGGTVEITNLMLSGKFGFLMHISKIDPEGRKVVTAGGEMLERYRISRSKALDIRNMLVQRNNIGELIHD